MSFAAAHTSRARRKNCQSCLGRKARFRYRGEVRADRDHTLCFECYRSERDRRRAQRLLEFERLEAMPAPLPAPLRAPLRATWPGKSTLTERAIAHRRTMLAHLGAR